MPNLMIYFSEEGELLYQEGIDMKSQIQTLEDFGVLPKQGKQLSEKSDVRDAHIMLWLTQLRGTPQAKFFLYNAFYCVQ